MADPVKVSLLKAIATAISGVSGVESVRRGKSTPPDRETDKLPAAYVYGLEGTPRENNRVVRITMPLVIVLWVDESRDDAPDLLDTISADIYKAVMSDSGVRQWCLHVRPDPEGYDSHFSANDDLGGITLNYLVEYAHAWGDPYDPARPT